MVLSIVFLDAHITFLKNKEPVLANWNRKLFRNSEEASPLRLQGASIWRHLASSLNVAWLEPSQHLSLTPVIWWWWYLLPLLKSKIAHRLDTFGIPDTDYSGDLKQILLISSTCICGEQNLVISTVLVRVFAGSLKLYCAYKDGNFLQQSFMTIHLWIEKLVLDYSLIFQCLSVPQKMTYEPMFHLLLLFLVSVQIQFVLMWFLPQWKYSFTPEMI